MSHTNPIALITGASRGLGCSAALALAATGWDIILSYQSNRQAADQVVSQVADLSRRAVALPLDLGESGSFPAFVETVQGTLGDVWSREQFDALVNNAGHGHHASFTGTTEAQFDALMRVHLKGPFFLTQGILPLIRDGGCILNVSSGLTRFSFPGYAAYASMKGAVEVMTRYMARELGDRGIRVNVIAPGAIETDFGGGVVRDNPELNAMIAAQTALGRVGLPDDIGAAMAQLVSAGSGWVNGQRIEASGGMLL